LVSAGQIELSTNTGNIANSRFEVGTYGGGQTGTLLEDVSVLSVKKAEETLTAVDNALQVINIQRANLGAVQNRFESTIANQAIAAENLTAANSRIKDADFAAETAALSRAQVLQQAGISILGQANALPQQVLSLLQ
jgi:flagellin